MKKLLTLLLVLVMGSTALTLTGCATTDAPAATQTNEIVLANFEQWAPDFQLMRLMNNFGAVSRNEDATYVKSGKYSAKLQPTGSYARTTEPYVYLPLASNLFEYNYCDLSGIEAIAMDLYNAQSENSEIEVGLVTAISDIESAERCRGGIYQLKPGWNRVVCYPDYDVINLSYDVTDVQGVYIAFQNAHVRDIDDAPVYYLDDLVLRKAETAITMRDIIELDEGELCDFEKSYQQYVIGIDSPNAKCIPDLSVVKAAEEGITAPHGENVLKVVTHAGDSSEGTWPRIVIPEKIVRHSGYMSIPKEQWGDYRFCFEVYAKDRAKTFFPEFYSQGGGNWTATNVGTRLGQWVTYTKDFTAEEFRSEDIIANPGFIKIAWAEYVDAGDLVFYFDNFRFEKKS